MAIGRLDVPVENTLPSSPLAYCEDRFSLLPESNDTVVPTWSLILAVLHSPADTIDKIIDHLETFSICIHGRAFADFSELREFLHRDWNAADFLHRVYPKIVQLALQLPLLFASGFLPTLTAALSSYSFSRKQIACLVVHQFLCTLSSPPWLLQESSQDFHIWYSSGQQHIGATRAYLRALFVYFDRIAFMPWITDLSIADWSISLTLRESPSLPALTSQFSPFAVESPPTLSTDLPYLGLPFGACVIFANKHIGFGRTGTQEEMQVGCSPEACPAMLFCPPLQDHQVLILEGTEAMITMEGYARNARLKSILSPDYDCHTFLHSMWRKRTMLFMDALELDVHPDAGRVVLDLLPQNINRELTKAYTGFTSHTAAPYTHVVSGLWGCGAFGGNPDVKIILQWCAASLAGVSFTFVCEGNENNHGFLGRLDAFGAALKNGYRVGEVLSALRGLRPEDEVARDIFRYILLEIDAKRIPASDILTANEQQC